MAQKTDIKDPAEVIPFTADFTDRLYAVAPAETISSIIGVTVTVVVGVDAAPSAILSGAASISGSRKIIQLLTGGLDGVEYKIKVEVMTSTNKELVIAGIVPVRSK